MTEQQVFNKVLQIDSTKWYKTKIDKVEKVTDDFPSLCSFYTDIIEEPLIASHFLVYSGPTVLLLMDGKEVYRGSQFIDLEELRYNINRYLELLDQ